MQVCSASASPALIDPQTRLEDRDSAVLAAARLKCCLYPADRKFKQEIPLLGVGTVRAYER